MRVIDYLKKIKYMMAIKKHNYEYLHMSLRRWKQFSATEFKCHEEKYLRLRIMIASHSIEKGFSHDSFKPGFGKRMVVKLYEQLQEYEAKGGKDRFVIDTAYALLHKYHQMNKERGFDDSEYLPEMSYSKAKNKGCKELTLASGYQYSSFADFAKSRSSVRMYHCPSESIERDEIEKCVEIGQLAPNACNRQAIRVHIVRNKELISKFEELQLGCLGFAQNAGALVIVTADLELYEGSEFRLPSIDAGLFMMNFVYACQDKNIYSCILNGAFPGDANNKVRELLHIPSNEDIEGCIVLYKVLESTTIKVPESLRRPVNEVCTFIDE